MDNVGGIWGIAQSTNSQRLITACLPLLSTDIPMLLRMKPNADQLKETLQLPSIKGIGGERQLRLVASWMDAEQTRTAHPDPVQHLDSLLPLVDLHSIKEDAFINFMCENNAIVAGMVTSLPPMQETREDHALAAAGSLLFAFGGKKGKQIGMNTSSCEFFDSRTNR